VCRYSNRIYNLFHEILCPTRISASCGVDHSTPEVGGQCVNTVSNGSAIRSGYSPLRPKYSTPLRIVTDLPLPDQLATHSTSPRNPTVSVDWPRSEDVAFFRQHQDLGQFWARLFIKSQSVMKIECSGNKEVSTAIGEAVSFRRRRFEGKAFGEVKTTRPKSVSGTSKVPGAIEQSENRSLPTHGICVVELLSDG
jgi:hypothetical protein